MDCQYLKKIGAGDEVYYYCELNEAACKVEYQGEKCTEDHSCPNCKHSLEYFSGLEQIPEYLYCPICNDRGYDEEMNIIVELI